MYRKQTGIRSIMFIDDLIFNWGAFTMRSLGDEKLPKAIRSFLPLLAFIRRCLSSLNTSCLQLLNNDQAVVR